MDIEKVFRDAVRSAHQKAVKNVHFTPRLQMRIRQEIQKRKQRQSRKLYTMAAVAACLVFSLAWWTGAERFPFDPPTSLSETDKPMSESELDAFVQKALENLYRAMPELKEYEVDVSEPHSGGVIMLLRKGNGESVHLTIDGETGGLETFQHSKPASSAERQVSQEAAIEKATAFLQEVLGEESGSYRLKETSRMQAQESQVINVVFGHLDKGTEEPFGAIAIGVDAAGDVRMFSRVNEREQETLSRMSQAVPDLKQYLLESKTPHEEGFYIVLHKPGDAASKARLSVIGKESSLAQLDFEDTGGSSPDNAPKPVAVEKATSFLELMLGDDSSSYRLVSDDPVPTFQRYYHDLPVIEDTILIGVDQHEQIRFFSKRAASLVPAAFPDPSQAVPIESAVQELAANMKLRYIENLNGRPLLEYTPAISSLTLGRDPSPHWMIDAKTGKMQFIAYGTNGIHYDKMEPVPPIPVNPPDRAVMVSTKEEAVQLLKNEFAVDVTGMKYAERAERNNKVYSWMTPSDKVIEVVTDASSGQVVELTVPRQGTSVNTSQKEALDEAVRFLSKYVDPGVKELLLCEVIEAGPGNGYTTSGEWEFKFFKSHQGIPVIERTPLQAYTVTVDPATGKANGFRKDGAFGAARERVSPAGAVTLPDKNNVVPIETAVQEYLKYLPLQLSYTLVDENGSAKSRDGGCFRNKLSTVS